LACVLAMSAALGSLCGCATHHQASGETSADSQVSQAVQRALNLDNQFWYSDVQVVTLDGNATLTGYLSSWAAKERAGDIAMFTPGVQRVQNDIILKN